MQSPGLVIIPAQEFIPTIAASAFLHLERPAGSHVQFNMVQCTIASKRNAAVTLLLEHKQFEWLLMLDSDMRPLPDTLLRLLAHDRPIVSALYRQKRPPFKFVAARADNGPLALDAGLQLVESVGAGCILIRRAVLEALPGPHWFKANDQDALEDVNFALAAAAAGFPVYVDTSLEVAHLTVAPIDSNWALGDLFVRDESERFDGVRGVALVARGLAWEANQPFHVDRPTQA